MFNQKRTLNSLEKRSEAIFSVFTKTQEDCKILNQEISGVISEKQEVILDLQSEVQALENIKAKNTNLADKINKFLTT